MSQPLLLCVATDLEGSILFERFVHDASIRIIRTGVGPVNAAHAVAASILSDKPSSVVICGVGGAYPSSGLRVGEVICASMECYGDLGASSPNGFLDMRALGFPVIHAPEPIYNDLPLQIFPTERRVKFVTMSTCTGIAAAAREIQARTGGAVENMEGAAIAHVARLYGIPVGELRGISNEVTDRDPSEWRVTEAATAAQQALLEWLDRR